MRAVIDYVDKPHSQMPRLLEVAFNCEKFHTHPGTFGLDATNPRMLKLVRQAMEVYNTAMSRKHAAKKMAWDKANPEGKKLITWARTGVYKAEPDTQDLSVVIALPERPTTWPPT